MKFIATVLITVAVLATAAAAARKKMPQLSQDELFAKVQEEDSSVVKFNSGILMKVLRKGTGAESPKEGTSCSCMYEGTLPSGKKFDSSYDRGAPISFAPNQVVPCWKTAMQTLPEGSKVKLWCPWQMAYGEQGMPQAGIPPKSPLIFIMEIQKLEAPGKPAAEGGILFESATGVSWDAVQEGE